jgi:alpha-beta hydrolase superfamily lysophospholipase
MDPVGAFEAGIKNVYENFKIKGVTNITLNIYKDARHEVLNEINREEVYQDIGNWMTNLLTNNISSRK